ncbi:hypothetical protein M885DRAFT_191986 [Pelagophyceae sp. CCMP2097]|nr:hypothetical protein M885DRAFT_191986 [Pelagophyceae sp. CCMP2097]
MLRKRDTEVKDSASSSRSSAARRSTWTMIERRTVRTPDCDSVVDARPSTPRRPPTSRRRASVVRDRTRQLRAVFSRAQRRDATRLPAPTSRGRYDAAAASVLRLLCLERHPSRTPRSEACPRQLSDIREVDERPLTIPTRTRPPQSEARPPESSRSCDAARRRGNRRREPANGGARRVLKR